MIFSCDSNCISLLNSLSAPMKFDPLSQKISLGRPLRAIKRISAIINESVERECTIAICIARDRIKVNRHPNVSQ